MTSASDEVQIGEEESLTTQEQLFKTVQDGNISVFMDMLNRKDELEIDLECQNANGDTVLKLAIKEGYSVLVQQLLKHDIQVSDALLKSVDVGFVATVKVICEYAENLPTHESRIAVLECHGEDQEFHPDVTPIILAAQRNDFTLVQILLNAGASIPENFKDISTRASDSLQKSVGLLEIYKGLASEAYVSQKYPDPVDRAFVLSDTLQKLSKSEVAFKSSYLELAETMNRLGTDIISSARSTEEILTVLSHHDHDGDDTENVNMGPFPKLSRAIQFDQRKFIAQSNCQQAVKSKFYGVLSSIRDRSSSYRLFYFLSMIVTFPFLVMCYLYIPSKRIKTRMQCPYVKFTMHLASDVFFITFITADVLVGVNISSTLTLIRPTRALILLWTVGIGWQVISALRKDRFRSTHVRNTILVVTLLTGAALDLTSYYFYLNPDTAIILQSGSTTNESSAQTSNDIYIVSNASNEALYRIPKSTDVQYFYPNGSSANITLLQHVPIMPSYRRAQVSRGSSSHDGQDSRTDEQIFNEDVSAFLSLNWWHPRLFATAMFSIATVVAFLRMLPYVAASNVVGALQISLWSMISKTSHFFLVLGVVGFSIAVGLTYIYAYYHATEYQICISAQGSGDCSTRPLSNLFWVVVYLYWSLFGLENPNRLELSLQAKVLERTGYLLYALFFVLVGLVLLNALIAVMTEVYNEIEINADIEWKFASTSMYLSFMQDGDVVPPPFNLLPSLRDFVRFLKFAQKELRPRRKRVRNERHERIKYEGPKMRKRKRIEMSQYQRVIARLVERYVGSKTAEEMSVESDVNITDIRELRNDMLTLKFDIFQRLQDSVEDIHQAIGKGYKTRVKSVDANSIFKRADVLHSTVNRHLKYVLAFKKELEATIAAIPDPPETTEKEVQTNPCGLTFNSPATHGEADFSDVDTPKVVVSNGSQTSSQWMTTKRTQTMPPGLHEIAMQTTREHLVDGRCQTIPPPETSKIDVSTQISRYVYPTGSAIVNGPHVHHKSKYKMLSCLIPGSAVQMDSYQTSSSSETTVQNGTSQTPSSPTVCESSVQTTHGDYLVDMGQQTSHDDLLPGHDDKLTQTMVDVSEKTSQTLLHQSQEVAVQAYATEFLVDCTSQTSLEVKREESLQTKGDATSQTSVVEINEETIQTCHEDLVDGSSQTPTLPAMTEGSSQTLKEIHSDEEVQVMPDVNDIKVQTSREYLNDKNSQTNSPPSMSEVHSQTTKEVLIDGIAQTIAIDTTEVSTQTMQTGNDVMGWIQEKIQFFETVGAHS